MINPRGKKTGLTLSKLLLLVLAGAVLWTGIIAGVLYATGYQHGLQTQRKGNFRMVKQGKYYQIFEGR